MRLQPLLSWQWGLCLWPRASFCGGRGGEKEREEGGKNTFLVVVVCESSSGHLTKTGKRPGCWLGRWEKGEREKAESKLRKDATAPRAHRRTYDRAGSLHRTITSEARDTSWEPPPSEEEGGGRKGSGQLLWNCRLDYSEPPSQQLSPRVSELRGHGSWTKAHEMDDFNGEVSCTEVLGIKPGEQALTHSFPLCLCGALCVCVCVGGDTFFSRSVFPCGQCFVHPCRVALTLPSWQLLR